MMIEIITNLVTVYLLIGFLIAMYYLIFHFKKIMSTFDNLREILMFLIVTVVVWPWALYTEVSTRPKKNEEKEDNQMEMWE